MLIVKVKICGITNYEDAVAALDIGADLLGFNFYAKSPRFIPPEKAREIISKLPGFIDIAGVFVNESIERIHEIHNICQLDWVQLHGDEDPEYCKQFLSHSVKVMKAIRVKDQNDVQSAEDYFTDAILLDAFDPEKYGGTGLSFDTTADIDSVNSQFNCCCCVIRIYPAGQKNAFADMPYDVPVEGQSRATIFLRIECI